jgi:ATP-dependent DNA helicase RecQ
MRERAEQWLRQTLGPQAAFHDGQWEAIEGLAVGRKRLLVVQKTGWGKSLVYFIATRLIREQGGGPTVLLSPLLALMRNQLQAARALGLRAETINSSNPAEHPQLEADLLAGHIDLVLISPERLGNRHFRETVWEPLRGRVGLLVIDEVHCISDWGHDFRPDYRRIMPLLNDLPGTPVLGTTATANDRVVADVREILGHGVEVLRGPLTRESLSLFSYREPESAAFRLLHLAHLLRRIAGSGIIYCTTTRDCLLVSNWLNAQGFKTKPYYASVEEECGETRPALEAQLLNNEVKALVASVALGMGFDKPDLSFVIHYQMPGSIVSYYQQIGRAGRGIEEAWVMLMRGEEDRAIQEYFIDHAFPRVDQVREVMQLIADHGPLRYSDLLQRVNIGKAALNKVLLHLELEGALQDGKGGYQSAGAALPDFERWARVSAQRMHELADMERYAAHSGCFMQYLSAALNDVKPAQACGKCMNCRNWRNTFAPAPDELEAARQFLLGGGAPRIEPRKQWMGSVRLGEKLRLEHLNEPGLALTAGHDEGWGALVRAGLHSDGGFSDALVEASAQLIRREWPGLLHTQAWVTAVPSLRQPARVADFARRLAARLELPWAEAVRCARLAPPQRTMENSYQQLQNIHDVFEVMPLALSGPVLLVDDTVDSGWTLTVVGWLLRESGAAAVYPFALAKANDIG